MKKTLSVLTLLVSFFSFSQNQEIGQDFIEILLKQKNFEKALTFLDASIKDKVTVDFLTKTSNQLDAQLGAYQNTISVTTHPAKHRQGHTGRVIPARCKW